MADLEEQAIEWLEAMGLSPEPSPQPGTNWHVSVRYPPNETGQDLHVLQAEGASNLLTIITGTEFSPPHVKAFGKLPDGQKRRFQLEFRRVLTRIETDSQIAGSEGPLDCPEGFQISRTRYEDGLSLHSFAHSVGAVHKAKLDAILFINQELGDGMAGPEQRFDFERLGI
jgi:hypothetical protein